MNTCVNGAEVGMRDATVDPPICARQELLVRRSEELKDRAINLAKRMFGENVATEQISEPSNVGDISRYQNMIACNFVAISEVLTALENAL